MVLSAAKAEPAHDTADKATTAKAVVQVKVFRRRIQDTLYCPALERAEFGTIETKSFLAAFPSLPSKFFVMFGANVT